MTGGGCGGGGGRRDCSGGRGGHAHRCQPVLQDRLVPGVHAFLHERLLSHCQHLQGSRSLIQEQSKAKHMEKQL